jgi:hypothetical protein
MRRLYRNSQIGVLMTLMSGACGRLGVDLLPADLLLRQDGGVGDDGSTPNETDAGRDDAGRDDAGRDDAGARTDAAGDAAARDARVDAAPMIDPCDLDADDDGTGDCEDECDDDPNKTVPGMCGCMVPDTDRDGDGLLDCVDPCGGNMDANYTPSADCGVGYCRTNNTPSSCVGGVETMCRAGARLSATDATCDGVDDDCSGVADEDYAPVMACGVGSCRTRSTPSRCTGGVVTACQPASPLASTDITRDGVDDDCDGQVDEEACVPHVEMLNVGSHMGSAGTCTRLTVKLWGAGGASGAAEAGFWGASVTAGQGGSGGYAQTTFTVNASSNIRIVVGQGGQGCGAAGGSAVATYAGGAGATAMRGNGTRGADGTVSGGNGANPSSGGTGGNGSFGGGGGGAGSSPGFAPYGGGGGGGAASVAIVDGARLIAGGGGGGGGAGSNITTAGSSGGAGGPGCSGPGASVPGDGGGGGGGGVCQGGSISQRGSGRTPWDGNNELPNTLALGGANSSDCQRGTDGFAIVSYDP